MSDGLASLLVLVGLFAVATSIGYRIGRGGRPATTAARIVTRDPDPELDLEPVQVIPRARPFDWHALELEDEDA